MKNKNIIFFELQKISSLIVSVEKVNVYSVSSSYFDNLSREIIEKIAQQKDAASVLSPLMLYQTPKGYFDNLSVAILKKISSHTHQLDEVYKETALIAPFLNTISKEQPYSVPADFFEKRLWSAGRATISKSKVTPFYKRSGFFRISAAAAVTTLLAIGLYTITGKNFQASTAVNNTRKEVKNLSKKEIVTFLKTNYSVENITSASQHANEIKSSLKEISDKEIQQYLKETGEADDI